MKVTRLLVSICVVSLSVCIGLVAYTSVTSAQKSNDGFTLDQVLSSPSPPDLVAAPKGERIAWVFDAEGKRNIWGAEGPDFKARQLTEYNQDTGQELTVPAFTHDGAWIVYVRGGEPNSAGEIPNPASDPRGVVQA